MEGKEFESSVLQAVVSKAHDKDVDDLTEEVNQMTNLFKDFKAELIEDMCQVIGLYVDRYAMDQFEKGKNKQQQKQ